VLSSLDVLPFSIGIKTAYTVKVSVGVKPLRFDTVNFAYLNPFGFFKEHRLVHKFIDKYL